MSEEQLKEFLEKVKADTSLQEKLKAAANADAVVAIAKEAGFSITTEDLKADRQNLSDTELEGVAGGLFDRDYCRFGTNNRYPSLTHPGVGLCNPKC